MAGSNQPYGDCRQSPASQWIVSEPRRLRAFLAIGLEPKVPQWPRKAGQFLVLQVGVGLLMPSSYLCTNFGSRFWMKAAMPSF